MESDKVARESKSEVKGSKKKFNAKATEKVANNTLMFVEAHQSTESEVILPTFSCKLKGATIHAFKDNGCQPCFIKESLATKYKLKTVRSNVEIKVGGFNTVQQYTSRIVEVPLTIGDHTYIVQAYTVPMIRFRLVLPGLSEIAQTFADKGYNLADEFLLNCNDVTDDIDFTLGSCSSHCLLTTDVAYGANLTSVYSDSLIGILLLGDVTSIKKDLLNLPRMSDVSLKVASSSLNPDVITSPTGVNASCSGMSSYGTLTDEYILLSDFSNINDSELCRATNEILKQENPQLLYYSPSYSENMSEIDQTLVKYALESINRGEDGRIFMPIFWNEKVCHLLGRNRKLAESILRSNFQKFKKE